MNLKFLIVLAYYKRPNMVLNALHSIANLTYNNWHLAFIDDSGDDSFKETLFTYGLYLKGYKILAAPHANTWHLKNPQGGIRSESNQQLYHHDELIFRNTLAYKDKKIVVLN